MRVNEFVKKNLSNLLILILVFFLDRTSKYLIVEYFDQSINQSLFITSFLNFNLLWNDGIAFGLLQFDQKSSYNFITLVIFIVLIVVIKLAVGSKGLEKLCYLMILGGGLGNIFDRIYYGSVIDFIDFHYKNFHWFIFNVADMFITVGILILIVSEFLKKND
tara:strand:- start:65 stop:550 length:486 start_codon:yes stop_codon:yes gene_type:complete